MHVCVLLLFLLLLLLLLLSSSFYLFFYLYQYYTLFSTKSIQHNKKQHKKVSNINQHDDRCACMRARSRKFGDGRVGRWCWGLSVRGRSTNLDNRRPRAYTVLAVDYDGLFRYFFSRLSFLFFFFPLQETVRYRLKYCLKGPLNQRQSTNKCVK